MDNAGAALVVSIVSATTAVVGMVISLFNIKHNRYLAADKFLTKLEDEDFIQARKHVYTTDTSNIEDESASIVVNFFHHWGMLAKKHYLPLWVFDSASGRGARRLYERLEPYIRNRRIAHSDPSYGEYYEWLYKKLIKRARRRDS